MNGEDYKEFTDTATSEGLGDENRPTTAFTRFGFYE
jgi:hypothetical protein